MSQQAVILAKNVTLDFRSGARLFFSKSSTSRVLDDISFEILKGEVFGIVGGNGAGKSTLLRLLAGIYQPSRGSIVRRVSTIALLNLQLGFDEQLNAYDNIILSGMLMGLNKRRMIEVSDDIIDYAELNDFAELPVRKYSSGMKARLGFSISKYARPDVVLLDEVLSVGDEHFRNKAENSMREMMKGDQTVIFVSHDAEKIRKLCNRVCWINRGRLQMIGQANDVMNMYESYMLKG